MRPQFIIAEHNRAILDREISIPRLLRAHRFKTLSLLLCHRAGIPTPPTLLLTEPNWAILDQLCGIWRTPLMIRMDYHTLPRPKPLGGISLNSLTMMIKAAQYLFDRNILPLFHPHMNRLTDVYSVGVLLNPNDNIAEIDVVGSGFDAGDLRLGTAIPHERIVSDLSTNCIINRSVIDYATYEQERERRIIKRELLIRYEEHVNCTGRLSESLEHFPKDVSDRTARAVPAAYKPLSATYLNRLQQHAAIIHSDVLRQLPTSRRFVASLSFLPKRGWMLWDVYGEWYRR